jgi:NAD dependent epimerase/dehydratase family enzyme
VRSIAKALNKKIILFRMPKLIVKLLFGERSGLLINSHCISASKIKKTDYQYSFATLGQALDHIVS